MATRFYKTRTPRLTIKEQVGAMLTSCPQFRTVWRGKEVSWTGELCPTPLSERYKIRIQYRLGTPPEVTVISPELRNREEGSKIPHLYTGNRLCLYFPETQEWDASMAVAKTIVPWTSSWLFYYEVWLATGKWEGGGRHPGQAPEDKGVNQ